MDQTGLLSDQGSFELAWGTTSRHPSDSSPVSGMPSRFTTSETCHKGDLEPSATMYRFSVRAINACGYGPWSECEEIFVPSVLPCQDPTKPCNQENPPRHYSVSRHEHDW